MKFLKQLESREKVGLWVGEGGLYREKLDVQLDDNLSFVNPGFCNRTTWDFLFVLVIKPGRSAFLIFSSIWKSRTTENCIFSSMWSSSSRSSMSSGLFPFIVLDLLKNRLSSSWTSSFSRYSPASPVQRPAFLRISSNRPTSRYYQDPIFCTNILLNNS